MNRAEDCNYWKTSKSSPDQWVEKTIKLIEQFGGEVLGNAFGSEQGRAAYMIRFQLDGQRFRLTWPVLPSEPRDAFHARRQAATMLWHHVKAQCVAAQVLGARTAFLPWVELDDGRIVGHLTDAELARQTPRILLAGPEE